MAGEDNPGTGRPGKWGRWPVDNMAVVKAKEVPMETSRFLLLREKTVPCVTAAEKFGKC